MAVAFSAEGDTGMHVLVREWRNEEHFEVGGFSVELSHCDDAIQLVVGALPPTDHQFKGAFDNEGLTKAGFGDCVSFENRLKTIDSALKGDLGMTATLKPDGSGLNLHLKVPMLFFEAVYKLSLKREQLSESHVKLLKAEKQLAESHARVAEMQQINDELMEASKVMEAELATTKAQLSSAASDCESSNEQMESLRSTMAADILLREELITDINSELRESAKEMDLMEAEMCKMKKKLAGASAELESMATEIRVRDERIAELESKEESRDLTTAGTREPMYPSVDFRFNSILRKGKTNPSGFRVTLDGKTATGKGSVSQLLLFPDVTEKNGNFGKHFVVFRLKEMGCGFGIGVTDDRGKEMDKRGCMFYSNGSVKVKNETVTESSPFCGAHIHEGDEIKLMVDLELFKVRIEVPNGHYTARWKPRTRCRVWFGFETANSSLTIV